MRHSDVKLQMIKNTDDTYSAVIKEKDVTGTKWIPTVHLNCIEKESKFGKSYMLVNQAKEEVVLEDGEDLVKQPFGFINYKSLVDDKTNTIRIMFKTREFRYEGLCFPIVGYGAKNQKIIDCHFDSRYYASKDPKTGEEYWKPAVDAGKLVFCFKNDVPLKDSLAKEGEAVSSPAAKIFNNRPGDNLPFDMMSPPGQQTELPF